MSDIFSLDRKGNESLESQAQQNPLDPSAMRVNSWTGLGQQAKRLMSGSASTSRTLGMAAGGVGVLIDKAAEFGDDLGRSDEDRAHRESLGLKPRGLGAAEWTFENITEGVGQDAVDYWTPDAATTGTAAKTMGVVFDVLGRVPQMFGATPLFMADATIAPATDVVRAGGSLKAAGAVGGVNLATNAIGMKIPAAWGSRFLTRMATGAAGNVAVGAVQNKVTQEILAHDGMDELAASYDPMNPESILTDAVFGWAFGFKAHVDARASEAVQAGEAGRADLKQQAIEGIATDRSADLLPSQRDAILAAKNADNFQRLSLPGEPREILANMQHQAAAELALAQLNAGRKVDVSGKVDLNNFDLRPELQPHKEPADWIPRGELATNIRSAADELGIDAVDLATVIGYESAGTFDPGKLGPSTPISAANTETGGRHFGLIQFGAAEAAKYGARPGQTVAEQMRAVVGYLKDRGVKPGMGMLDVYSTINAGAPGRYNARDGHNGGAGGTVRDKVNQQMADHRKKAEAMFKHGTAENFGLPDVPRTVVDNDPLMQAIPEGEHGRETNLIDTPEREAMRDQWVEEHFAQAQQRVLGVGEKPVVWVLAGGGGSGKGTLLNRLQADGAIPTQGAVHIDPDAIKTGDNGLSGIPEYGQFIARGDGRAAALVHEESSQVADRVLERAVAGKYDIILDRTLGNPEKGVKQLQALKDAGYKIRLRGVTVDPGEAVIRAVERAQKKFRYVPLKELLKAHKGFSNGWDQYAKIADNADLYDNSGAQHKLIATVDRGMKNVLDRPAYTRFVGRKSINEEANNHRSLDPDDSRARAGTDPQIDAGGLGQGESSPGSLGTGSSGPPRVQTGDRGTGEARQELSPAEFPAQGADSTVVTERGLTVPVKWAVVDVADLVTSHDNALNVNPDFPADLQPRDRARAASEQQIARISNSINPELLADSPKAADGAPIIGPDKVVESGNARTIALRRAYAAGKADDYRQFLLDNAERFGIDPRDVEGAPRWERSLDEDPKPGDTIHVVRLARPGREGLATANAANIDGATYLLSKQDDFESSVGVPDDAVLTVWAVKVPDQIDDYQPTMGGEKRGGEALSPEHFGRGNAMRADASSVWYSFGKGIDAAQVGESIPLSEIRAAKQASEGNQTFTYSHGDTEWLRSFVDSRMPKLEQPMLVRVNMAKDLNRADFARQANESTVASMSATEQAMADAARLPDMGDLKTNDDGTINMRASAKFVSGFIESVGPNERGAMSTADGQISQQGQARIRNAVFARAYGDADLVAMMSESTDANVKNVLAGMLRAAPEMARLREMIDEGGRYGPDISPDLTLAARKFSQLRSEGMTVPQFEAQADFFGGGLSPKARELLGVIGENSRAPKRMAEFIQRYVDTVHALGDPRQPDLMGDRGSSEAAIGQARDATAQANPEASAPKPGAGLFNAAGRPTETPFQSAQRVAIESPGAMILDGFDADGNPTYRNMLDALEDIESARTLAEKDAEGYTAAANCFTRRGSDAPAMSI